MRNILVCFLDRIENYEVLFKDDYPIDPLQSYFTPLNMHSLSQQIGDMT